ncbi:type I-B CRISPR-associated endonuclease Cas1b [Veillonella magna]|uniref:type I-B CRISPR-associated endonuclease Cas1b n=2 Tax=Veillonella TaxID=29465 RepID=UPI00040D3C08|nr:type I-B CRISPR-associated endonuclease Cas1b [Veillonella magna]MBD8976959.1 type I-B CRISPR-associated endonuclease Cas1 [Veillonella magna]
MKQSFYIYSAGRLERKDNTVHFVTAEGKGRYLPIETISDLYIMGEVDVNSRCLNFLGAANVAVHFFNYYSFYTGSFYPREKQVAGKLLVKQVEHYQEADKRLTLAKAFVQGAMDSMYRNLRYYNSRGKDVSSMMGEIKAMERPLSRAITIQEVMGCEGMARKAYYSAWNTIVDQEINFTKREKRPPTTMINSLISYVNMLIYTKALGEIYHTALNPTISYLHEPGERRFSLCLDITEIFKPLIGDRLIFRLLNKKQITQKSFTEGLNYLHLKPEASRLIAGELEESLKKTIMHKDLGRQVSYQYLMRLECFKLTKHFIGEKNYEPFVIWW